MSGVRRTGIRIAGIAREAKGIETENVTEDPSHGTKSVKSMESGNRKSH
jgi:hypothetical protein